MSSTVCEACAQGTVALVLGSTTCWRCEAGTFSANATTPCQACAAGKFAAQPQASSCDACEPGYVAMTPGLDACSACSPGTYSNNGSTQCLPCPDGTFALTSAASVCEACVAGKYTNLLQECQACPRGAFTPSPGYTTCLACPTGTFAEQTGQSYCAACDPGSFSNEFTPGSFASRASFVAGDSEIITSTDGIGSNAAVAPWYLAAWRPQSRHGAEVILFTEFGTTRLDLRQVDLATNEVTTLTSLALPDTSSDGNQRKFCSTATIRPCLSWTMNFVLFSKLEMTRMSLVRWCDG